MYTMEDFKKGKIGVRVGRKHLKAFLNICQLEGLDWGVLGRSSAFDFTPYGVFGEELTITYGLSRKNSLEYGRASTLKDYVHIVDYENFIHQAGMKGERTMYTMEDFKRKKIIVRVDKDRLEEFLGLCEDEGMLWISGNKPRECRYWIFRSSLRIFPGNGITVCTEPDFKWCLAWCNIEDYKCHYDIKIVDMKDFLDHLEPAPHTKYKITIESDGTTTTAHMEINGKQVKSTQAKLHPVDKFNFKTGAEMAFGRLWEGEKKTKKKEPIFNHEPFFKVGDRVVCEYADDNYLVEGKHGKIIGFTQNEFLIEFDDYVKGHNGNGLCGIVNGRNGHCWYCDQRRIHHE